MAFNFLHRGGAGSKERSVDTGSSGEIAGRVTIDPLKQQLIFIAHDEKRVADDAVINEIDTVFSAKNLEERRALAEQVLDIRHPERVEARRGQDGQAQGEGQALS